MSEDRDTVSDVSDIAVFVADFGLSNVVWGIVMLLIVTLGIALILPFAQMPSHRLSADESAISLSEYSPSKLARMRAPRVPARRSAWNALADVEDDRRIRANLAASRATRRVVALATLAGIALALAALLSLLETTLSAAKMSTLSASTIVRVVGLTLLLIEGWYAIPVLALWTRQTSQRARSPLAWRILARGHALKALDHPVNSKWMSPENPRGGRISVARAARLLKSLEAEAIYSTVPSSKADEHEHLRWSELDSRRLTRALRAKADLLDRPDREVAVADVYAWHDLVVTELVQHKTHPRALRKIMIPEGAYAPSVRARAKRVLWLGFWQSPAGLFSTLLCTGLTLLVASVAYPAIRSVFEPHFVAALSGWAPLAFALIPVLLAPFSTWLADGIRRVRR